MPLQTTVVRLLAPAVQVPLAADAFKPRLVKVSLTDTRRQMALLEGLGLDLGEDATARSVSVLLWTSADLAALERTGLPFVTKIADLVAHDRAERAADRRYTRRMGAKGSPIPSGRTEYRTYEDIQADLKSLAEQNPGLVRPITLKSKTFQGRDMQAVEIADGVTRTDDGRPTFVLVGVHHAREWPAAEAPLEFARLLVDGFKAKDRRIAGIVKRERVIVMPLTNADGYIQSRTALVGLGPDDPTDTPVSIVDGAVTQFQGYRRKNCDGLIPAGAVPCALQWGIDNNRNYGSFWGGPGASSTPIDPTYRGPAPFSEPETNGVRELVSERQATMMISMHNVAALVLRPPGLQSQGLAPDEARMKSLGDAMGRATGYTSQFGWELYDTSGTTEDWTYPATGGYGYTIEIGPSGGDFHMRYEDGVVKQWTGDYSRRAAGKGLREALLLAAETAKNPVDLARLAISAPRGSQLTISKEFDTKTSAVCLIADITFLVPGCNAPGEVMTFKDKLTSSATVPKSGKLTWSVNPSTRPFERREGRTETWHLTCATPDGEVKETRDVVVDRGKIARVKLRCR
jgi:hypothetical protein